MTVYPIQESFEQPLQPDNKNTFKAIDTTIPNDGPTESEDEPAPHCEGEKFANREEVLNTIEAAYKRTKNLQIKLLHFAHKKIIGFWGKKEDERITAEDIVSEAIFRIITLDRKWYTNKVEKIENLILMVIVSLIRIEAEKRRNEENSLYKEYETETEVKPKKSKKPRIMHLDYHKSKTEIVQQNNIIDTEAVKNKNLERYENRFDFEQTSYEEYIDEIEKLTENNDNEFFTLHEILNGNKSNIDIANKLEVDVKKIENARKSIKRKILKITTK